MRGYLAVKDVGVFSGRYIGWEGPCSGEIVRFHSVGFCWDILTDPAYQKKIVITDSVYADDRRPAPDEIQSFMPHLNGLVFLGSIRKEEKSDCGDGLGSYLEANRVSGFIPDRRDLLRDALDFSRPSTGGIDIDRDKAINNAGRDVSYDREDLKSVSAPHEFYWDLTTGELPTEKYNIVVWDFGASYNLLRGLRTLGCRIRIAPPNSIPEDLVPLHPDGVIIAGGPSAAENRKIIIPRIERMIGIRPLLGVGDGAVLLASAMGIETENLESPHFGTSIPVEDTSDGKILATYQAHSITISSKSATASRTKITHRNLIDNTVEGFKNDEYRISGSLFLPTIDDTPAYLGEYLRSINPR